MIPFLLTQKVLLNYLVVLLFLWFIWVIGWYLNIIFEWDMRLPFGSYEISYDRSFPSSLNLLIIIFLLITLLEIYKSYGSSSSFFSIFWFKYFILSTKADIDKSIYDKIYDVLLKLRLWVICPFRVVFGALNTSFKLLSLFILP